LELFNINGGKLAPKERKDKTENAKNTKKINCCNLCRGKLRKKHFAGDLALSV